MRANKISTVNKKVFTVDGVKGVDLSSSPTDISSKRAATLVNMICENGVNHKRHGREREILFKERINGIYCYNQSPKYPPLQTIVHSGSSFYRDDGGEISSDFEVSDNRSMAFQSGDKLFIIGCGAFCFYDGESIRKVCSSDIAYIPKTTIGISEKSGGSSYEKVNMLTRRRINTINGSPSKFAYFYLDSKIDKDKNIKIDFEAASADTGYKFFYDSSELSRDDVIFDDTFLDKIFGETNYSGDENMTGKEINVYFNKGLGEALLLESAEFYYDENSNTFCTVKFKKGDNEIAASSVYDSDKKCYKYTTDSDLDLVGYMNIKFPLTGTCKLKGIVITGKVQYMKPTVVYSADCSFKNSEIYHNDMTLTDTDGNKLLMYREDESGTLNPYTPTVYVDFEKSRIYFDVPSAPFLDGEDNITVNYSAVADGVSKEYENIINGCTFGEIISDGANSDILIISGYDEYRNRCFFSESTENSGFTYFPDLNYASFGDARDGITALIRLSDGSLGVFKDKDFYRATVNFTTDSENLTFQTALRKYDTADTYGCFNPYVCKNVNSDSLVLSYIGVLGVMSQNNSYERSLTARSSKINSELCKDTKILKNAVACEHDGRYYLFLNDDNGTVYVADSRYKYYESERLDTSYEYEWWVFNGLPARYATVVGNEMLIGTDDGEIYKFGKGYEDGYFKLLNFSDFKIDYKTNQITVNALSGLKDKDRVMLPYHTELISENAVLYNGKLKFSKADFYRDGTINIFEGADYYVTKEDKVYKGYISDIDYDAFTVTFHCYPAYSEGFSSENSAGWMVSEYISAYSRFYDVCQYETYINGVKSYYYKLKFCGKYVSLSPVVTVDFIKIDRHEPVKCLYISPTFDLGSYMQPKDLFNLSVIGGADSGAFTFGYETLRNISEKSILRRTGNDFNNIDFNEYSFNGSFTQSCTMRTHERNFNFIRFMVFSDSNNDCSFESLSAIYTVKNNILKGVK